MNLTFPAVHRFDERDQTFKQKLTGSPDQQKQFFLLAENKSSLSPEAYW